MTLAAFLFMSVSVLAVTGFAAWCYYRLLRKPPGNKKKSD